MIVSSSSLRTVNTTVVIDRAEYSYKLVDSIGNTGYCEYNKDEDNSLKTLNDKN